MTERVSEEHSDVSKEKRDVRLFYRNSNNSVYYIQLQDQPGTSLSFLAQRLPPLAQNVEMDTQVVDKLAQDVSLPELTNLEPPVSFL